MRAALPFALPKSEASHSCQSDVTRAPQPFSRNIVVNPQLVPNTFTASSEGLTMVLYFVTDISYMVWSFIQQEWSLGFENGFLYGL